MCGCGSSLSVLRDQDGVVKFEEFLQGEFSDEADGTAVDSTLDVFVFHQRFANLADVDM